MGAVMSGWTWAAFTAAASLTAGSVATSLIGIWQATCGSESSYQQARILWLVTAAAWAGVGLTRWFVDANPVEGVIVCAPAALMVWLVKD